MNQTPEIEPVHVLNLVWTYSYETVAAKAQLVREILAKRNVRLRDASALSRLLRQAEILSSEWEAQRLVDMRVLAEAAHVIRLADSIAALSDEPNIQEALRRMAGGVMQPGDRNASQGKDALWEIALLADLRRNGLSSKAAEPDIVVDFGMGEYPIACKKIWSAKGLEGHISKGAKQLAPFANGGIIALNIDDLVPAGRVIVQEDKASARQILQEFNLGFIDRNREVLQRAVMNGKCDGFIVSTTAVAVLTDEEPSFNLGTQSSFWHLQEAGEEPRVRFLAFKRAHQ